MLILCRKIHEEERKQIVSTGPYYEPCYEDETKLIGNPDAKIWAEEFVKLVKTKPTVATDEGTMIGWFANAIMAGYDKGQARLREKILQGLAELKKVRSI